MRCLEVYYILSIFRNPETKESIMSPLKGSFAKAKTSTLVSNYKVALAGFYATIIQFTHSCAAAYLRVTWFFFFFFN